MTIAHTHESPFESPDDRRTAGHRHEVGPFTHSHAFTDADAGKRANALTAVTVITFVTMIIELVAGYWSGSLALTADGWHMGTHAVALGGAALAYRLSQKANNKAAYAFGGWKIEVLSGYSSGLLLLAVALWLIFDSVRALMYPEGVNYRDALIVAVLGLLVNLASAWLLSRGGAGHGHAHGHSHGHGHGPSPKPTPTPMAAQADARAGHSHAHGAHDDGHGHGHGHGHDDEHEHDHGHAHSHAEAPVKANVPKAKAHDHNFNAAYIHVLADLFTSVLAVAALCGGLWFGWRFLDPAVALLGAAVIGQWSIGVLRDSATALVDASSDAGLVARVRSIVESDGDAKITDLHVWQVGTTSYAAILCLVADKPLSPASYRERLGAIEELRHVTVEVNLCPSQSDSGKNQSSTPVTMK